jgi:hypothetical protein
MGIDFKHKAMDEVYSILLYNPNNVDDIVKKNLISNLTEYYTVVEEYEKCIHLQELLKVMEKDNENNNQTSWW